MQFMDLLDEYLELKAKDDLPYDLDHRSIPETKVDSLRMNELREELNKRARGEL